MSIGSLIASVDEAYEQVLSKVDQQQQRNVRYILEIVVGARRALTIYEMAIALDIATRPVSPTSLTCLTLDKGHLKRNIQQWCGLFVFINHSRLYLIHQTVKGFLLR